MPASRSPEVHFGPDACPATRARRQSIRMLPRVTSLLLGLCVAPLDAQQTPEEPIVEPIESDAVVSTEASGEGTETEPGLADPTSTATSLPPSVVIGSREAERELAGSGAYLEADDIRTQSYDDVNRAFRRVPGVYLRDEDGFGLFPNISLRGVDTGRSAKLTLMEDGVLSAPAAYSAPEAYVTSTVARMHAIEVLKGSSQIRFGPHTTGGVINYLSTPIPGESKGRVRAQYGSENDVRTHAYYGNTIDTKAGSFGFLVEGYFRSTDGFKTIDSTPDFANGDATGFSKIEPMIKLSFEPKTDLRQKIEAKFGYSDIEAGQTYLGLSEADFSADPYRRYAASRFDVIKAQHLRTYIRHTMEPIEDLEVTTTLYYNDFHRNWFKLNELRGVDDGAGGVQNMNLSAAIAGANGGRGLDVLRGAGAGTLRYRHNNRDYYVFGVESVANYRFFVGETHHDARVGLRVHQDEAFRRQKNEDFVQAANGTIADRVFFAPGSQELRTERSKAIAVYVEDKVSYGDLTVTPGVRYEHVRQKSRNFNTQVFGNGNVDVVAPGIGATYDLCEELTLFTGVHRGFSVPSPAGGVGSNLDEETSLGFEIGQRFSSESRAIRANSTFFFTSFDDLIVNDNIGGSGSGVTENVGEAESLGFEQYLEYDPGKHFDWVFDNPWFVAFTYTNAELASDSTSTDPESLFAGGRKGAKIPYVPEFAATLGTGVEFEYAGFHVTGFWVDETFTTASNTATQVDNAGNPDARFGKTDSYFVVDVSGYVRITETSKIFGGVQNLFDDEYVASRHPHGPRPGMPLFAYLGLEIEF
jgi:Fe(3+) dicitrate transport protein